MDVFKAANKVGAAGRQVVASAMVQHQLETERKVLADLRAEALSLRAQIGEEMYKLWKAGQPSPPWLDELCEAIEGTTRAIARQRALVDQLVRGSVAPVDDSLTSTLPPVQVAEVSPPSDGARAAEARIEQSPAPLLIDAGNEGSAAPGLACPKCGAVEAPGRRFCGSCGSRLA